MPVAFKERGREKYYCEGEGWNENDSRECGTEREKRRKGDTVGWRQVKLKSRETRK